MNRVFLHAAVVSDILDPSYPAKKEVFPDPKAPDPTSWADRMGEMAAGKSSEMNHASCTYTQHTSMRSRLTHTATNASEIATFSINPKQITFLTSILVIMHIDTWHVIVQRSAPKTFLLPQVCTLHDAKLAAKTVPLLVILLALVCGCAVTLMHTAYYIQYHLGRIYF